MEYHIREESRLKTTHKRPGEAVVLIPQPSDDLKDPLNWPARKKHLTLAVLCFSCFAANLGPTSFQLAYVLQAPTYHKTPVALSYGITAAVAGLFGGPIIFSPLARVIGRSSLIFWSMVGVIICQIWAASMTSSNDYTPFIFSRWMAGMFAALPSNLTPAYIMDIFFLHQRGRAFTSLEISLLSAVIISPTLGGFIVETKPWPYVFWWTVIPIGLALILVFCFLEETGFERSESLRPYPEKPASFVKSRIVTFFPGSTAVPHTSAGEVVKSAIAPFMIGIAPITILAGLYAFVAFGFTILLNLVNTIILQTPKKAGGYSFSPLQNALFQFTAWAGVVVAQLAGWALGDRIPLWASRRGNGTWQPEYRLWNMFLPALFGPIGLGIFGAGVQYHLHYMVLALGFFLVTFSSTLSVPVCLNYIIECFITSANEAAVIMSCYRLAFAIPLGFFVFPWENAVGLGWTLGMAAFFDVFAALLIVVLALKGKVLRRFTPRSLLSTEEGEKVTVVNMAAESAISNDEVAGEMHT
ncbi:MAG: hypothetical protein M1830_003868 [Pleopsidium flavum]|nr:MAG: hypothetical protein M1830_003868 [Pleopsidium flavum]